MKIHKIRKGFATNSSSTHSLLIVANKNKSPEDYLIEHGDFGWDSFIASSDSTKRLYLACLLQDALRSRCNPEIIKAVLRDWLKIDLDTGPDAYIDHQSVFDLPVTWDEKGVDPVFFRDFADFIMRKDLVITGGNDNNGDDEHAPKIKGTTVQLPLSKDCGCRKVVARKDSRGYWVVFNRETGTKVRFTFSDKPEINPEKADNPELVDLKITSYCPYGCAMCYQDSTKAGIHADTSYISRILGCLADLKVFEVALGGGEPTLHPDFWKIINDAKYYKIVPNFSTRNLEWLHNPAKVSLVKESCGAFAYSVGITKSEMSLENDLQNLAKLCEEKKFPLEKVSVQYVVGSGPHTDFVEWLLKHCYENDLSCTLLGYKTTGRGKSFKPFSDNWQKAILKVHNQNKLYKVGIDTMLAKEALELEKMGIPEWCLETEEGKFSMYIDCVEKKIGPSSYCKPKEMVSLPSEDITECITKNFAKW